MQFWCRFLAPVLYTFGALVWFLKPLTLRLVAINIKIEAWRFMARMGHAGGRMGPSRDWHVVSLWDAGQWQNMAQEGSVIASSTSKIGMSSLTG